MNADSKSNCPYHKMEVFGVFKGKNVLVSIGPSNRSNSVSSLDMEAESVSDLGPGPSVSNGVEALQLLEHEQGLGCYVF